MADQRMTWDHDADKALLGCMQDEIVPTQDQLRGVMNRMHAQGYTCTVKAITQHLQKLRKKEGGSGNASATGDGAAPATTPKTPRKRAPTKAKTGGTKTPASKGKRKVSESVVADDDDLSDDTPIKKMKTDKAEPAEDDFNQFMKMDPDEEDDLGTV